MIIEKTAVNYRSGGAVLSLYIPVASMKEASRVCNDITPGGNYDITVKKHRKKRSINANGYLWALIQKIAEKLNKSDIDVYREEIRHGTAFYRLEIEETAIHDFVRTWAARGVGWIVMLEGAAVDRYGDEIPGRYTYRAYYGSSVYDSKQMADLLDRVIQDAAALDIETATPREIAEMKAAWKGV